MSDATIDLALLDPILDEFKTQKGAVIPILQRAQDAYGYLPKEVIAAISKKTRIPLSQLYGVVTFYAQFNLERRGRHIIRICDGTACHVRGAPKIVEGVGEALNIEPGGSDPDYKYTLEVVYCVGACGLAPVVLVNNDVHGNISPEDILKEIDALE
jgi:NADH:ubiquinone oxidoreductase subunit E